LLASSVNVSAEQIATLQQKGIGLYAVFEDRAVEQVVPVDLALNVQLPELNSLPRQVRELLGPVYEQFARSHWREGFEDACQVLETEARRYLHRWSRTGRIQVLRKHGPVALTAKEVNKMTMGQLAINFANIQAQNHADNVIGKALATVNRDRVAVFRDDQPR